MHFLRRIASKARAALRAKPRPLLFEHVPKCAGTTIKNYLLSQYSADTAYQIYDNHKTRVAEFKQFPLPQKSSYQLVIGHGAFNLVHVVPANFTKATVLRDPVERIISHYYYVLRCPEHYLHQQVKTSRMSLRDYALSGISGELTNCYTANFLGIPSAEAEKSPEESVAGALEHLSNDYDIVGFVDDLPSVMNQIRRRCRLPDPYTDTRTNVTNDRPPIDEIDVETKAAIEKTNALDILLYSELKSHSLITPSQLRQSPAQ